MSHWEVSPLYATKSCLQMLGNIIWMLRPFTTWHYARSRVKEQQHCWSILPAVGLCEVLLQICAWQNCISSFTLSPCPSGSVPHPFHRSSSPHFSLLLSPNQGSESSFPHPQLVAVV